ncbi:hypothetical protein [Streptomyces sp. NPDC001759]
MIVAVGHDDLTAATLKLVEEELRERLEHMGGGAGLVRAGAGLPVAFGRAVRASGRRLVVLLPAQHSVPAALPGKDREGARELLLLAEEVRLAEFDPTDRGARGAADERLVRSAGTVLAVWDGSPSDGGDATAHLVAYARARGIPVDVVWPEGAARTEQFTA